MAIVSEFHFEDAEIFGSIVTQCVSLIAELKSSDGEVFFDLGEEVLVGHGIPCLGVGWGWDFEEGFPSDLFGSAVKEETGRSLGDDFWFE